MAVTKGLAFGALLRFELLEIILLGRSESTALVVAFMFKPYQVLKNEYVD